jgi:hypothetical protein
MKFVCLHDKIWNWRSVNSADHVPVPVPVAVQAEAWACGLSLAGNPGLNPAGSWMFVLCVVH